MAQILDPLPADSIDPILCCYINATSQIQVARITNIENWYFERVVFPGQRLVFEALPHAQLEIHTGMMASAILSDTIPCERLRVNVEADGEDDSSAESTEVDSDDVKNREADSTSEAAANSDETKEPMLASVE